MIVFKDWSSKLLKRWPNKENIITNWFRKYGTYCGAAARCDTRKAMKDLGRKVSIQRRRTVCDTCKENKLIYHNDVSSGILSYLSIQWISKEKKKMSWVECSLFRSLLVWVINKVFFSIKPDAEEEPEGGGGDPKTITYRIAKKKQEKLERNNSIKNQSYSFMMMVCSLCNCESRRNCSPRGSGGPFSRCISRTQNSGGTWALSKLNCTTPILIQSDQCLALSTQ